MPLSSNPISELTIESASKKLWHEYLSFWFDGASHVVGTNPAVVFPKALIVFDQGPIKQPMDTGTANEARVEIRVVCQPGRERTWEHDGGRMARSDVVWNFWIKGKPVDAGDGRSLVQRTAELLKAILTNPSCAVDLARAGIQHLRARKPSIVPGTDWNQQFVSASGQLIYQIKV